MTLQATLRPALRTIVYVLTSPRSTLCISLHSVSVTTMMYGTSLLHVYVIIRTDLRIMLCIAL